MAMRGQGAFLEKEIKKRIYQQRANQYNQEFDALEDQGHDPEQIPQILEKKAYQQRHANDQQDIPPYERSDRVLPITGSTHLGFQKAHLVPSETKQMLEGADQRMKQSKAMKLQGLKTPEEETFQIQKQNEQRMKARIQYDHIRDLHAIPNNDPKLKVSHYANTHKFTSHMQEECDTQNFDHHQKKNDLKQYQEAYIICKKTLRK